MRTLCPLLGLTIAVALAAMIATAIPHARAQAADPCAALAGAALSGAEVESAQAVRAGTVAADSGTATDLPGFCRVRGLATPTPRSRIHFDAWLPLESI